MFLHWSKQVSFRIHGPFIHIYVFNQLVLSVSCFVSQSLLFFLLLGSYHFSLSMGISRLPLWCRVVRRSLLKDVKHPTRISPSFERKPWQFLYCKTGIGLLYRHFFCVFVVLCPPETWKCSFPVTATAANTGVGLTIFQVAFHWPKEPSSSLSSP